MGRMPTGRTTRLAIGGAALLGVVAAPGVAFAAGTGYAPGGTVTTTGTGAFGTVLVSQTVGTQGGTVSVDYQGTTIRVTVPAGDFSAPVQVVITAPQVAAPQGQNVEAAAGVAVEMNGSAIMGMFAHPLAMTVSNASITASSEVVEVSSTGAVTPVGGVSASNGSVMISVPSDPSYAVLSPAAATTPIPVVSAPIAGATSATTGKPFIAEGLAAFGLLAAGAFGLRKSLRRVRA